MAAPKLQTYFQQFTSNNLGECELTGILDIQQYHSVDLMVMNFPNPVPNLTVQVLMGKISGSTLGQWIETFPADAPPVIHSYRVMGPELSVVLVGAPPNTSFDIQAWVFLH
jgi:hypothetical protein